MTSTKGICCGQVYAVVADGNMVQIDGYGITISEHFRIDIDFYDTLKVKTLSKYEEVASTEGSIHTVPHPLADRKTKSLVRKVLAVAKPCTTPKFL